MNLRRLLLNFAISGLIFWLLLACISIFHYGELKILAPLTFSVIVENATNSPVSNVQVFCKDKVVNLGTIPQHWRRTALLNFDGECGGISVTCNDHQETLLSGGFGAYLEGYPGEITATINDAGKITFHGIPNFFFWDNKVP